MYMIVITDARWTNYVFRVLQGVSLSELLKVLTFSPETLNLT